MRIVRKIVSVILFLISIIHFQNANAQLERVRVAFNVQASGKGVLEVAVKAGLFKEQGLNVELINVRGAALSAAAVSSGQVNFAQMGASSAISSTLAGADFVMLATDAPTIDLNFITSRDITKPSQLKGKKVGITRFGGAAYYAAVFALEKFGFDSQRDVHLIQIGEHTDMFTSLKAGAIDGALLASNYQDIAREAGFNNLGDLPSMGFEFVGSSIVTTRSYIEKRQDVVRKFIKAYASGVAFYHTKKQNTMKILSEYWKLNDLKKVEESYLRYIKALPKKPYIPVKGIKVNLESLIQTHPKAKDYPPEKFIDNSFLKELDLSGYIDSLYKQ